MEPFSSFVSFLYPSIVPVASEKIEDADSFDEESMIDVSAAIGGKNKKGRVQRMSIFLKDSTPSRSPAGKTIISTVTIVMMKMA